MLASSLGCPDDGRIRLHSVRNPWGVGIPRDQSLATTILSWSETKRACDQTNGCRKRQICSCFLSTAPGRAQCFALLDRNMQRRYLLGYLVTCLLNASAVADEATRVEAVPNPAMWHASAGVVKITPEMPLRMAGYGGRVVPAEGTEQDLFAKILTLQDYQGRRLVIITFDLIGVDSKLRSEIARQLQAKHQLDPASLLLNASHTHCGPLYTEEDGKEYLIQLVEKIVRTVGETIDRLEPVTLSYSTARASIAMNRRTPTEMGYKNHPNPDGLVDHAVPVLAVRSLQGELRAILFGYACHNTTMGFKRWLGDYAGYAQEYLQQDHPSAVALFMMGCGGDQNPYPRSDLKYAQRHGRTLATAVEAALEVNQATPLHQHSLRGPLRSILETVPLKYTEAGRTDCDYTIQTIRFGDDLLLVALASEVTVDYSHRLKIELKRPDGPAVWVAGYSNDMTGYIPSKRVLLEGGYEAESRPWDPALEEAIISKVHDMANRLQSPSP